MARFASLRLDTASFVMVIASRLALVAAFAFLSGTASFAQPAKPAAAKPAAAKPAAAKSSAQGSAVAQFGDWGVFTGNNGKGKICYAATQPKKRAPDGLKRGPAFIFITSRPSEKVANEVSIGLGYPAKGDVTLSVAGTNFALYAKDEGAWVKNAADEAKVVAAMRGGQGLTIVGTSPRGNKTTDSYSTTGLAQALEKVAAECK